MVTITRRWICGLSARIRSCTSTRHGGSAQRERSCVGYVVRRVANCLTAAKIRDGDGCVTNGGWCGASGWGGGLSASESWRSWRDMEAMRRCTFYVPNVQSDSFLTTSSCSTETHSITLAICMHFDGAWIMAIQQTDDILLPVME